MGVARTIRIDRFDSEAGHVGEPSIGGGEEAPIPSRPNHGATICST
jgi:hypothetical protein